MINKCSLGTTTRREAKLRLGVFRRDRCQRASQTGKRKEGKGREAGKRCQLHFKVA